ncbi:uncharacterized protein [Physcomitrium patens]|uniref:uncharacterized protein isoform X3 n=1 Tax=Physcomitrium patens TaxID=3218 RepID=UPI003CCDC2B3
MRSEGLKDFSRKLVNVDAFVLEIQEWIEERLHTSPYGKTQFRSPFQVDQLRTLDYALVSVSFQQLLRMPVSQSYTPSLAEPAVYLAVEDFMHTATQRLWETFWDASEEPEPMPFYIMGPHTSASDSLSALVLDKASSRGSGETLPGAAIIAKNGSSGDGGHVLWDHVAVFVEVREDVTGAMSKGSQSAPSLEVIGRALFHGLLMLTSRSLSKKPSIRYNADTAYVLFVNSRQGGVVRLKGDVSKLETNTNNVYVRAAKWIKEHAEVTVCPVEQVWNRFGNSNWGDMGAMQLLLAIFHSIEQCRGPPRNPLAEMAALHNERVQHRLLERENLELQELGETGSSQRSNSLRRSSRPEILEIEEEEEDIEIEDSRRAPDHVMKLEPGTILWLEDAHWQRGFQIQEQLGRRNSVYSAISLDEVGKPLAVHIGAHPSQLEPSWEDMSTWYQVQRQTRVLNIMKQRGVFSKYLTQIIASGRLMHPGPCSKKSPASRCDHPWCGTPVLVTAPIGETVDLVVEREGVFPVEEALRICHDCLSALRSASSIGIQHGDITPDHVIRVTGSDDEYYYVLSDWGHAVLEERDSPALSPQFSSTAALQDGKLYPASDTESLVYLLYYICGGIIPEFDSMEAALQWRDRVWARRIIQQQLGEVSAVLKAFADYVDTLCGTPYPVDYDIWLHRLARALSIDPSKNELSSGRLEFMAESSGTSAPSVS